MIYANCSYKAKSLGCFNFLMSVQFYQMRSAHLQKSVLNAVMTTKKAVILNGDFLLSSLPKSFDNFLDLAIVLT